MTVKVHPKEEATGKILISITQKTISMNKLLKLTNEYWELGWNNPAWTDTDKLHVLNYMRFLEKRLTKKTKIR